MIINKLKIHQSYWQIHNYGTLKTEGCRNKESLLYTLKTQLIIILYLNVRDMISKVFEFDFKI